MRQLKRDRKSINWSEAEDIKKRVLELITNLQMDWILFERIFFYRSTSSKARAYARTWGLPRLWQRSLDVEPAYIIEVLSEHFDKLSSDKQDEVLLHELTHIPKNFSGSLTPHTRSGKNNFHKNLERLKKIYYQKSNI